MVLDQLFRGGKCTNDLNMTFVSFFLVRITLVHWNGQHPVERAVKHDVGVGLATSIFSALPLPSFRR